MNLFHALLFTLAMSNGADFATTVGCPQPCQEYNPTVPNPAVHPRLFLLEQSANTAGELYLLDKLHRHHPKLATAIAWACVGVETELVASNLHSWNVVGR